MADGLKIRIFATDEIVTKSQSHALALIERKEAELVGEADGDGLAVRLKSGEVVTKSHGVALALITRGEATAV
jgi:hypothetical protein